jgi:hypothetical protein
VQRLAITRYTAESSFIPISRESAQVFVRVAFDVRAKAKEEEAIKMALPWLRGKVETGRYHSTGGSKKSKRAIKSPLRLN